MKKSGLINITKNFYRTLYQETILKPSQASERRIINVGPEDIPDITIEEVKFALFQTKNKRELGYDCITNEMIRLSRTAAIECIKISVNIFLTQSIIPELRKVIS